MEKIINLKISNQKLTGSGLCSVNRTVGLMYCEFEFDSTWNDYPVRSANFKRDTDPMSEAVTRVIINGSCRVPDELLKYKGVISVAVQGENTEGQTERTEPLQIIKQTQTITDGQNVIDPSPDQYTEFIERAGEAIEEYFEDHKSEFKGDPGEPGEPGEDYILTESDRQEIAGIAVEEISPVLAKKVERIRLTCDDSHIYLDEVQQNYEQVLAMVQDGTKYVTLLYADCISLQPHGWDGAAVYFMSSYINDNTAYIDRFIINNLDRCKFTETTLALGDDLAELQGEVSSVKESLNDLNDSVESLDTNKVGFSDYASSGKAGIVLPNGSKGFYVSNGYPHSRSWNATEYQNADAVSFISKGTLENVVDPSHVVHDTDYASASKGGVVKTSNTYGAQTSANGYLQATTKTLDAYNSTTNTTIIGKGTLENVLAERLKEPQFELIESITLTSDGTFSRSAEPNGTPYNFKALKVFLIIPTVASTTTNYVSLSPTFDWSYSCGSFIMSSSLATKFKCEAEIKGGLLSTISGYNQGGSDNSAFTTGIYLNSLNSSTTPLNSIKGVASYSALPNGTTVKIYGIRA